MRTKSIAVTGLALLGILSTPSSGRAQTKKAGTKPNPGAGKAITAEDRAHWAFQPLKQPEVPSEKRPGWGRNPIDRFILASFGEFGLSPSPDADRATLLRRVSFDLTGLPPTPQEVREFLADARPGAYERAVDRLLASPHRGERFAQHWLDLARHADTDGFEFDHIRPDAWKYRDWVVQAINRDLPIDQFLRLQVAGDELAPDDPSAFIATGFHRGYPDMVDLNDQGLRRQNALNDITETTGLSFLGLTIGCARCHDHKFEPIRQVDFFRLQAFFTPARFRDDFPIASPAERARREAAVARWESDLASAEAELIALEAPIRERLAPGLSMGALDEVVSIHHKAAKDRTSAEVLRLFDMLARDRRVSDDRFARELGPEGVARRKSLQSRIQVIRAAAPPAFSKGRGLDEATASPGPTFLLIRGEYPHRGQEVSADVPTVLEGVPLASIRPEAKTSGRRTALANWLTRPDHPLTNRVFVNRVWQQHFGKGIVATPSDFGTQGSPPTHPELLDWLAAELVRQGYSLKAIQRLIVTSSTYRQSCRSSSEGMKADPENTLVWRQNRRRLDGEAIRDAILAASGQLDARVGGPPVYPELPAELGDLSKLWPVSLQVEDRNRRSLYVFIRRNLRYPFFEVFDRPDTNASCPRRSTTTIATQSLSLLNSKLSSDAANSISGLVKKSVGDDVKRQVGEMFLVVLGRAPGDAERTASESFVRADAEHGLADLALGLLNSNGFLYLD